MVQLKPRRVHAEAASLASPVPCRVVCFSPHAAVNAYCHSRCSERIEIGTALNAAIRTLWDMEPKAAECFALFSCSVLVTGGQL